MAAARSRTSSKKRKSTGTKGTGRTLGQYRASLEPGRRKVFDELRELVAKGVPAAKESMAYGMPTWELGGEPLVAAASQKHYLSLYFCGTPVLDRHREAFAHLDCGKCCIRFRKLEDLPVPTLRKMFREAARERSG